MFGHLLLFPSNPFNLLFFLISESCQIIFSICVNPIGIFSVYIYSLQWLKEIHQVKSSHSIIVSIVCVSLICCEEKMLQFQTLNNFMKIDYKLVIIFTWLIKNRSLQWRFSTYLICFTYMSLYSLQVNEYLNHMNRIFLSNESKFFF